MKMKQFAFPAVGLAAAFLGLVLLVAVLFASDDGDRRSHFYGSVNLSAEVLAHKPMVEKYAAQYGITKYVNVLLAIIQVESSGTLEDAMQSSESMGLPPDSLDTEGSIRQGCKYFSGLTQWCYGTVGITLPRTAQAQYDAVQHIPMDEAKAGDLVFFQGTYHCGDYITHVGIYVGNNQMYHAGNPIGFVDLPSSSLWLHLVCAGRVA